MQKSTLLLWIAAAIVLILIIVLVAGYRIKGQVMDGDGMENHYAQISQDEAKRMMQQEDCVIVDVRRTDEYAAGHIPGAICIPNETIGEEPPAELPDKQQTILVYCRSGNRSKQAAQKLFDMGYLGIFEFGGILDWTGETVTGTQP
ncbi:MAG: rhodanese-like domain-containing protein [Acutalibacteraceae bacterium]